MEKETVNFRFLLSIIRHFVTSIATLCVAWGWVDAQTANAFSESAAIKITTGIIALAFVLWNSYRDKIWEFLKTRIAILLPPNSTIEKVAAVAKTVENKAEVAKGNVDAADATIK